MTEAKAKELSNAYWEWRIRNPGILESGIATLVGRYSDYESKVSYGLKQIAAHKEEIEKTRREMERLRPAMQALLDAGYDNFELTCNM